MHDNNGANIYPHLLDGGYCCERRSALEPSLADLRECKNPQPRGRGSLKLTIPGKALGSLSQIGGVAMVWRSVRIG